MFNNLFENMTESRKVKLYTLGLLLLLIPFFKPGYFEVCVPAMDLFFNLAKVPSALIIFVLSIRELFKSRRISAAACAFIVMEGWAVVDILLHQGLYVSPIAQAVYVLVVCALIESQARRHADELINAFLVLYELLIGLNFLCMLLIPQGMYYTEADDTWKNWLLGYRNIFAFYFIPALALELVNRHRTGKRMRLHVMMAICTISMIQSTSKTGLLIILAFDALYLTKVYRTRIFNVLSVGAVYIAAFVSIVVLGLQTMLQPLFDLLGRSVTFTGRTRIWERTIQLIAENPVLGYGVQPEDVRGEVMRFWSGIKAHNFILEQQYCFGIIGTVLMIVFCGVMAYGLYRARKHPCAGAICLGLAGYAMLMLMEGHINNMPMYSFLFLSCFVRQFIEQAPSQNANAALNHSAL